MREAARVLFRKLSSARAMDAIMGCTSPVRAASSHSCCYNQAGPIKLTSPVSPAVLFPSRSKSGIGSLELSKRYGPTSLRDRLRRRDQPFLPRWRRYPVDHWSSHAIKPRITRLSIDSTYTSYTLDLRPPSSTSALHAYITHEVDETLIYSTSAWRYMSLPDEIATEYTLRFYDSFTARTKPIKKRIAWITSLLQDCPGSLRSIELPVDHLGTDDIGRIISASENRAETEIKLDLRSPPDIPAILPFIVGYGSRMRELDLSSSHHNVAMTIPNLLRLRAAVLSSMPNLEELGLHLTASDGDEVSCLPEFDGRLFGGRIRVLHCRTKRWPSRPAFNILRLLAAMIHPTGYVHGNQKTGDFYLLRRHTLQ